MAARFEGKVALVTGAVSGIGLASVERLAAEGARVLACDIQDEKGAALEARYQGAVRYQRCDVTRPEEIGAAVAAASEAFGGLDILFNNAGAGGAMAPLEALEIEAFRAAQDLLVTSVVAGTKFAIAPMAARGGGAIINTASIAGLQNGWGPIAYSTAKAAVIHFTRCAAAQLAAQNIRVNAICPGLIATSIFGAALGLGRPAADQMAAMVAERGGAMQPIGRAGRPEDIAGTVAWLASADAAFVTGAHIVVDGGITTGPRHGWDPNAPSPIAELLGLTPEQAAQMAAALRGG